MPGRRRRAATAADFIIAGRALPLWLVTLTMTATWVDGGYLLGTPEGVYGLSMATGLQGGVMLWHQPDSGRRVLRSHDAGPWLHDVD